MICKICGKECCDKLNSFGYHLSMTHKIKYKNYYDKYLKKIMKVFVLFVENLLLGEVITI